MTLSNPTVTTGVLATAVATSPAVNWREKIGASAVTRSLPDATIGYECQGVLGGSTDSFTLDLSAGSGVVTDSSVEAIGVLTLTGNAVADETVTIGTTVYTWKATPSAAYQVKMGATASDSIDNLIAAINADAGAGILYGTGTAAHPDVSAQVGTGDTMNVSALVIGSAGNSIATTETMTAGSFGSATLTDGVDASSKVGADGNDIEGNPISSLKAGADAYVEKSAGAAQIAKVLREFLADEVEDENAPTIPEKLSKRQKQLLVMLDRGLSNRDIAEQLQISEHTVKVHLWRLFRRLGVKSRTQTLHFARSHGLL